MLPCPSLSCLPIFYLSSLPGRQNFCAPGSNCFYVDIFFFLLCPSYSGFGLPRLGVEYISRTSIHMRTHILKLFHVIFKKSFYSFIKTKSAVSNFLWFTETKRDYFFENVQLGYMMKNGTPCQKKLTNVLKQTLENDYTAMFGFTESPNVTSHGQDNVSVAWPSVLV